MRRIDDRQPRQARIAAQRRAPGYRAAPVVTDERKALDRERIGERENVVDQQLGLVRLDVLRPVGSGEAALVGHDQIKAVLKPRRDLAPGAVRFGKAMEQDDRRVCRIAGQRDIQSHSGAQRNAPELGHG